MSALVPVVIADFVLVAVLVAGVVFLVRRLRARAAAARTSDGLAIPPAGGWSELAARFATDLPAPTPIAAAVSIMVGPVIWRRCAAVGAGPDGLFLSIRVPILGTMGRRPLKIPWREIGDAGPARLYWKDARALVVGRPTIATVVVPLEVREALVRLGHMAG